MKTILLVISFTFFSLNLFAGLDASILYCEQEDFFDGGESLVVEVSFKNSSLVLSYNPLSNEEFITYPATRTKNGFKAVGKDGLVMEIFERDMESQTFDFWISKNKKDIFGTDQIGCSLNRKYY